MTYRHIDTAQATPVQLGAMGKIEIIEEVKRLRALVKEMTGALDALFEYPDNGTAVHPGALVWEDARTALAKAREIAP